MSCICVDIVSIGMVMQQSMEPAAAPAATVCHFGLFVVAGVGATTEPSRVGWATTIAAHAVCAVDPTSGEPGVNLSGDVSALRTVPIRNHTNKPDLCAKRKRFE